MNRVFLSIVVPFFNEELNVGRLHMELTETFSRQKFVTEVVYVDDGSNDKSAEVLRKLIAGYRGKKMTFKLVILRRNFGQTAATVAGIDQSSGKLVGFLDADLQNDPRDLLMMMAKLDGAEAVIGWRTRRQDGSVRNVSSRMVNILTGFVFRIPVHDTGCTIKIVRRKTLNGIRLYGEYHRLLPIILFWKKVKILEVPVRHRKRTAGKSNYSYFKIFRFLIDLVTIRFFEKKDYHGKRRGKIYEVKACVE